jgi:transposase
MVTTTAIGVDIAKSVFQVHEINASGEPVVRRELKRHQAVFFQSGAGNGLFANTKGGWT